MKFEIYHVYFSRNCHIRYIFEVFHLIKMDILAREKATLEVKQSSTLVLLPNSITIRPYPDDSGETVPAPHPLATHRISLDIKYATTMFSVMVTMENPLDFVITTPHLLPMKYLDDKPFPPGYPNTSLVELV